jgi:hypothetical protein
MPGDLFAIGSLHRGEPRDNLSMTPYLVSSAQCGDMVGEP